MQINKRFIESESGHKLTISTSADYARLWLSGASVDDLVRVSRLLKHMCDHRQVDDDYEWSTEQVRKITGYTGTDCEDYTAFDDALREGLRELAKDLPELNVCPVYRPAAGCQGTGD